MPHVISWCGFIGAWLLVAGPLDQAIREVEANDYEHETLERAAARVEQPHVSRWWALLPPVWWVLRSRQENEFRHRVAEEMDDRDLVAFLDLRDIVNAWGYIAAGAALIGVKETWDLHEAYEWPTWTFWGLVALMVAICVTLTRVRYEHRQDRPTLDD